MFQPIHRRHALCARQVVHRWSREAGAWNRNRLDNWYPQRKGRNELKIDVAKMEVVSSIPVGKATMYFAIKEGNDFPSTEWYRSRDEGFRRPYTRDCASTKNEFFFLLLYDQEWSQCYPDCRYDTRSINLSFPLSIRTTEFPPVIQVFSWLSFFNVPEYSYNNIGKIWILPVCSVQT